MPDTTIIPSASAVCSAAAVLRMVGAKPPEGLDGAERASWYAELLGGIEFHAELLAGEIQRLASAR